jgi:hypothetical protein
MLISVEIDDDSLQLATEALVFMLVSHNAGWKLPCTYFLTEGLSGDERVNFVTECLTKLYDKGVIVTSLTCNGPPSNFAVSTV